MLPPPPPPVVSPSPRPHPNTECERVPPNEDRHSASARDGGIRPFGVTCLPRHLPPTQKHAHPTPSPPTLIPPPCVQLLSPRTNGSPNVIALLSDVLFPARMPSTRSAVYGHNRRAEDEEAVEAAAAAGAEAVLVALAVAAEGKVEWRGREGGGRREVVAPHGAARPTEGGRHVR